MVVFVEYLTKWVEAYAVEDQTSETIAEVNMTAYHPQTDGLVERMNRTL